MELSYQVLPYECDHPVSKEDAKVYLKYRGTAYNINCSVVNQASEPCQTLIYRGAIYVKNLVLSAIAPPRKSLKYRGVVYS
ncbi:DUF4278 domain-containing protein [Halotia wernerae UHCC 0503]|nr:DUF4278 domain-containing protein [Halotia wernerae UHCC 0503]